MVDTQNLFALSHDLMTGTVPYPEMHLSCNVLLAVHYHRCIGATLCKHQCITRDALMPLCVSTSALPQVLMFTV